MTTMMTISDVAQAHSEESEREPISMFNGLVGFFDILGYKSLLLNNETAQTVPIIRDAFIDVIAKLKQATGMVGHIDDSLAPKYIIFSDSILVHARLDVPKWKDLAMLFFLQACQQVVGRLFLEGLPLRGAIAIGEYCVQGVSSVEGSCFAGKPIVEARELSDALQLAGCAITPPAEEELLANQEARNMLIQHLVPLKPQGKQNLFMLDYSQDVKDRCCRDRCCRQWVIEQFEAHNKRVGAEVIEKVNNTIEFLEECSGRKH